MNSRQGGLGKGLAALIPAAPSTGEEIEAVDDEQAEFGLKELSLSAITPNSRQPRGVFDPDELEELSASIRDMGILQPIVVRPMGGGRYELIAGERRLRASKLAGLTKIPALVRNTEDTDMLKEALVENIHRVQLNALEEAAAYQQLLDDFSFTQEELSKRIGKSRPSISNALRLLTLPAPLQRKVAAGVLSAGHAKAILALDDRGAQELVADKVVNEGLSVRATEELVRLRLLDEPTTGGGPRNAGQTSSPRGRGISAPGLVELQDNLSDALMARVRVTMGARTGKLTVEFGSVDDLERIVGVIHRGLQADI